jgi:hypothetical protein
LSARSREVHGMVDELRDIGTGFESSRSDD